MNTAMFEPTATQQTTLRIAPELSALVRGTEQSFVLEIAPLLDSRSVELDLSHVIRIDAAGIAALVALYRKARNLGRSLTIVFASRHVKEVLKLVGLEGVLMSHHVGLTPHSGPFLRTVAA